MLVLKNATECTSHRLKWTSGARDMILVFRIYSIFSTLQNCSICLDLSFGSMLELLVLKNAVECLVNISGGHLEPEL